MTLYVLIVSNQYPVYADIVEADDFMRADPNYATWDALGDETQGRYLVAATRLIDRQRFPGDKTSSSQELEWPRTDTGIDGVVSTEVPAKIIQACTLLAYTMSQGSEVDTEQNQGQKIQSLKAGSVGITYFRGAEGIPTRFPTNIQELLRDYLEGASDSISAATTGADGETITGTDYSYTEGL